MKRIALIGSTGSIGNSTLSVVEHLSDRFSIFALAANSTVDRLAERLQFRPVVAITDQNVWMSFGDAGDSGIGAEIVTGSEGCGSYECARRGCCVSAPSAPRVVAYVRPLRLVKRWRSPTKSDGRGRRIIA
jgi:1-deoxy-D-xylulose 5-phosphate reductoisomerase